MREYEKKNRTLLVKSLVNMGRGGEKRYVANGGSQACSWFKCQQLVDWNFGGPKTLVIVLGRRLDCFISWTHSNFPIAVNRKGNSRVLIVQEVILVEQLALNFSFSEQEF